MEAYEVNEKLVMDWLHEYASYDEVERIAKQSYALYVEWRKKEYPEQHKKAKAGKKYYKSKGQ